VQDAVNLGWKLAQVVHRTAPESLLDTYHAERHPVAARVLRITMAQVALMRRDDRIEALQPKPRTPAGLLSAFTCIHHYEGAWNANTGNGYYGGLQLDRRFQSLYGSDFVSKWGTADNWPTWAQLTAAVRAYQSGRGFYPWPNTARACGLI